jgi:exodeoxyribonuclease VII large subunit
VSQNLKNKQARLVRTVDLLQSLSPLQVVARGFSIVRKENKLVKSVEGLKKDDLLEVQLSNGKIETKIVKISLKEK